MDTYGQEINERHCEYMTCTIAKLDITHSKQNSVEMSVDVTAKPQQAAKVVAYFVRGELDRTWTGKVCHFFYISQT